jgi:hypothetical protein
MKTSAKGKFWANKVKKSCFKNGKALCLKYCIQQFGNDYFAICRIRLYIMRFEVLTVLSMKMRVFWYTVPCSFTGVDRRFRCAYCIHRSDDGRSIHIWNIHLLQWDYMALYPRRFSSSDFISLNFYNYAPKHSELSMYIHFHGKNKQSIHNSPPLTIDSFCDYY